MAKKTIVHVNQFNIRDNRKHGTNKPVLTTRTYNTHEIGNTAIVKDDDGNEIGRFVYSPDKPLSCGARVWFETRNQVQVLA